MDDITLANLHRYESDIVHKYINERLHELRYQVAGDFLQSRFTTIDPSNILELAPGGESLVLRSSHLVPSGTQLYVLDLGHRTLRHMIKGRKDVSAVACDLSKTFPLTNACFDGIIAMEIIEHLFDTR